MDKSTQRGTDQTESLAEGSSMGVMDPRSRSEINAQLGSTHFIDPSKVSSDYDLPDSPSSDGSSPISSPDEPGYKNNSFSIQNILGEGSKSHLTSTIFEQTSDNVDFNNNHKSSLNSVRHSAETLKQVRNDMAAILKPTAIRESAGIPIADSHWLVPPGFTQIQPSSPLTPPNVAHAWSPWCSSPFGLPRPLVQGKKSNSLLSYILSLYIDFFYCFVCFVGSGRRSHGCVGAGAGGGGLRL